MLAYFIRPRHWLATLCMLASPLGAAQAQTQTLSVLSPHGLLDFKVISEFERMTRTNLRVELTTDQREPEMRLKHSISNWDVVIASETELLRMAFTRLIRPMKDDKEPQGAHAGPLSLKTSAQEESRAYLPLMADPLGIAWLEGTRSGHAAPTWKALITPAENPFWRGRVFLPQDSGFQFRVAMMAVGLSNPQAPVTMMAPAFEWLKAARHQGGGQTNSQLVLRLVEEQAAAGPMWKSSYLRARKLVRAMEFAVPTEGSYFTRFGAAVVADTLREELALNFISFLATRRDELARFAGLVPLSATQAEVPGVGSWRHYDESLPLHRDVEEALRKITAAQ